MDFRKSHSSVKSALATATVLPQSVEKSLALESENSKLRYHVLVLSRRLHEVIAELKARRKITGAFYPFCGDNYNQVDCELWMERVEDEERRLEKVGFAGGMDVVPLEIEEEVVVVAEKKFVVRLLVAVAESVAGADEAEDVAMVEVARKGKEVVVVAEEAEGGVGSREKNWTLVKMKVRERGEERRRMMLEEERDAVRKKMNGWRPAKVEVPNAPLGPSGMRMRSGSDSGYGSPGLSGFKSIVGGESVERVGESVVPRMPVGVPMGPRSYAGVAVRSESRLRFRGMRGLGSVPEGKKIFGLDFGVRLVAYGTSSSESGFRFYFVRGYEAAGSDLKYWCLRSAGSWVRCQLEDWYDSSFDNVGFRNFGSSVKSSLATAMVLQQSVEKSLALESENSKLRHHALVLSRRLHEVIAELKAQSKIMAAFCPFCGDNHNQVHCELWMERVVEEESRLGKVEFAGGTDVEPLMIEEEVAVVAEKKFVVRLPVAVAELLARVEVAENVAMVEVAGNGKEVAVVGEEAEGGVGSREKNWTVVKRRVRASSEDRRRRWLEEERDAVRKRINV
ncbi:hypothetical protein HOY80DRAFT_1082619 [Tuber brumale]|nr:hypothetical protein HOY80DRAFT_1082619 [Tuber brumale]